MLRLSFPRAFSRPLFASVRPSCVLYRLSSTVSHVDGIKEEKAKWEFKLNNGSSSIKTPEYTTNILEEITQQNDNTKEQPIELHKLKIETTNLKIDSTAVGLEESLIEIIDATRQTKQQNTQQETEQNIQQDTKQDSQQGTQQNIQQSTKQDTQQNMQQKLEGLPEETQEIRMKEEVQEVPEGTPTQVRTRKYYVQQISLALAYKISDVFMLCAEMKQAGVKPDISIMNMLINAYARIRCSDLAFIMFDQILQLGLTPNSQTLENLLTACDVGAEMYRAQEIVKRMRQFDVWPSMVAHSYLISIYVKNNRPDLAWAEYEALKALNNASLPDVLGNFFRLVMTNGDNEWLAKLLTEMHKNQIEYTRYEISRTLEIFLLKKDLLGCLLLLKLEGGDLQEGTLVKILQIAGEAQEEAACHTIFEVIRARTNDAPSSTAYYALLARSLFAHDVIGFLTVVNDMSQAGHKLGGIYATKFARICTTTAQIDQAFEHLASLKAQEKFVGVDALSAVMRACALAGDTERAMKTFTECFNTFNMIPDIDGFNSIIEASEKAENINQAENIIEQMTQNGVAPTVASYESLIRTCIAVEDLGRATAALSQMAQHGLQPTYQIYAGLAALCARISEFKQANAIINSMVAAGMKPAESLVLSVQPYHKKQHEAIAEAELKTNDVKS